MALSNHRRSSLPSQSQSQTAHRGMKLFVAIAALIVAAASCALVPVQDFGGGYPWRASSAVLTTDGVDNYMFSTSPDHMTVAALGTNTRADLRTVFYPTDVPTQTNAQSCATWTDGTWAETQQGAALRISTDWAGNTRAITVTKNVFGGFVWVFNIHLWISGPTRTQDLIAQFNLKDGVIAPNGALKPFPWRMCARAIGPTIDFKVWPTTEPEPVWGNPAYGGSATVPDAWVYAGHTGWYAAHLSAGNQANFTDLASWKYVPATDAPPTTAPPSPATAVFLRGAGVP